MIYSPLKKRNIRFDINLLEKCDNDKNILLDLIRKNNNLDLNDYVFQTLCEKLPADQDTLITWGVQLDQSNGWFEVLLSTKKNINTINGTSIMHKAVTMNSIHSVQKLLEMKASPNKLEGIADFPLYVAAKEGHLEIVQLLVAYDANLEERFRVEGYTPLYIAAHKGRLEIVKYLIEVGAKINAQCIHGSTSLYIAMQEGQTEVVRFLLEKGADIRMKFRQGSTPLFVGARYGHNEAVEILLQYCNSKDLEACDDDGSTPLYMAAQNGHTKTCELLLEKGAIPECQFRGGYTPLYIAAQNGFVAVVELMIRYKANPSHIAPNGSTAFYVACQNGHIDVVKFMCSLENKNDFIHIAYAEGYTPLYVACQKGHFGVVKELVAAGADVNCLTLKGVSPLYTTIQKGHLEIVNLLIANGANVNFPFQNGFTPLHIACIVHSSSDTEKCISLLKVLIGAGANPLAMDQKGATASECAKDDAIKHILLMLEQIAKYFNKPLNLLHMFDSTCIVNKIEHYIQVGCQTGLDFAAGNVTNMQNIIQAKIWLDLLKNTNSFFGHTVILCALLEKNNSDSLTRVLVNLLGFDSAVAAKDAFHATLMNYLYGNTTLLDSLIKPILKGINKNKEFSSGTYDAPFLCFNFHEEQMKKLQLEDTSERLFQRPANHTFSIN